MICDVLVLGSGPAATIFCHILLENNRKVVQAVIDKDEVVRPNEVISSSTRRILADYGLLPPEEYARECRGTLTLWKHNEPDFYDHALYNTACALTINRSTFHQLCRQASVQAGIKLIPITSIASLRFAPGACNAILNLPDSTQQKISCHLIVDATGRQSKIPTLTKAYHRIYYDKQVAFSIPIEMTQHSDCLLLEAGKNGWWYIPPPIGDGTQLVFLTDSDLTLNASNRHTWLEEQFRDTRLIKIVCGTKPDFRKAKGTDARFSRANIPSGEGWMAIGDSALALDPLSGTGNRTAIEGARMAAADLCATGSIFESYTDWCTEAFNKEWQRRAETYFIASEKFSNHMFWERRRYENITF